MKIKDSNVMKIKLEELTCCFLVGAASGVLKSPQQQSADTNANGNVNTENIKPQKINLGFVVSY